MRLGIIMGLHLNISESQLKDRAIREHGKRIWWTLYLFERMWSSRLGHPISISDDDIDAEPPSNDAPEVAASDDFRDPEYIIASIDLARLAGQITASIYSRKRQKGDFSQRVQQNLRDLRGWIQGLPTHLKIEKVELSETLPRPIIYLHLSFNQVSQTSILYHIPNSDSA